MFFLNIDKYAKWWQIFFELTLHYIEDQLISIPTSSYVSLASNFWIIKKAGRLPLGQECCVMGLFP